MKMLFTDLDDTLLNNESQVSPITKIFLNDFLAAGNRLVLSSGRPLASVMEIKEAAGLNRPGIFLIGSNGTRIYDCDRQCTLLKKGLPLPWVSYLQEQAKTLSLHIQTYKEQDGEPDAIISPADDEEIRFYRRKIHLPMLVSEHLADALSDNPCKMLAISLHNFDKLETFRKNIADWAKNKVRTIYSSDKYLEIYPWDAGKGSSLLFLCDYLGIPVSDTYAAGDAENDISMLEAAGCGIAMKNASDKVKAHANVVTNLTNDQNGLADMMYELLR